jgi:hypothetical protein
VGLLGQLQAGLDCATSDSKLSRGVSHLGPQGSRKGLHRRSPHCQDFRSSPIPKRLLPSTNFIKNVCMQKPDSCRH